MDDAAIDTNIIIYNNDENMDINVNDMKINATLGQLRIIFLNWFVNNVLDFLDQFQAAQAALIEASQAAAETAKQNLQSAYSKAKRIVLNIDLKAPDIIVPENSRSYNALLLDMGRINLSNQFKDLLTIKNENGHHAVIDEIKMKLSDFKLIRVHLDSNYSSKNYITIWQPMTFTVLIKRNLSSAWYKALPELDVSGHINVVNVRF